MKKVLLIGLIVAFAGFAFVSCSSKKSAVSGKDTTDESAGDREGYGISSSDVDSGMDASSLTLSNLQRVYFDFDNATLRPDAIETLKRNYEILKKHPNARVTIEGHCDERGSEEYNLALGERRAESVKRYLSNLGIQSSRMNIISYGEEKPLVIGQNEAAWSKNRRGEILAK